jgi:hypothetical protein
MPYVPVVDPNSTKPALLPQQGLAHIVYLSIETTYSKELDGT